MALEIQLVQHPGSFILMQMEDRHECSAAKDSVHIPAWETYLHIHLIY